MANANYSLFATPYSPLPACPARSDRLSLPGRPSDPLRVTQRSEPIFNVPAVVVATIALCVLVHVVRAYVLSPDEDIELLLTFAFIPARYDSSLALQGALPGGWGADVWTFLTYAFIHGDL